MSGLALAALIAVAAWLAALSFVVVLLVRQLGLVTMRLSVIAPHAPADAAGPAVGSDVPDGISALVGRDGRPTVLLLLSSTCATCRAVAAAMGTRGLGGDTVVLVAGSQPLASSVADLLPPDADIRFDPDATRIARGLRLDAVPFGLRLESKTVAAKAYLHGIDDVARLEGTSLGDKGDAKSTKSPRFKAGARNGSKRDMEVGA